MAVPGFSRLLVPLTWVVSTTALVGVAGILQPPQGWAQWAVLVMASAVLG